MKHWALLCLVAACQEDVQLFPPMSVDGAPQGDAMTPDGSGTDGRMCVPTMGTCDVDRPCCANRCTKDGMCVGSCLPDGMACTDSQQCCGLDCNGNMCGSPPTCRATGALCMTDGQCCCGSCMGGQCVVTPISLFQPCPTGEDWHCVQGWCNAGVCAMNLSCKGLGFNCTQNHDCCLGYCFMGHCENASCSPSG